MASPHVAGVAALFLEADPNLSPAGVAESMFASSSMNVVSNANTEPNRLAHTGQLTLSAQGVPGGSNQDSSSTRQVFEFLSTAIALLVAFLIV